MPESRSIFARPAGPTAKWVVFAIWVVGIFIAAGPANLPGKFTDAEENESTSFLPGDAESTHALTAAEELQGGELAPAVIVYRRESGLTPADREKIVEDVQRLTERRFPGVVPDGATAAAGGEAGGPPGGGGGGRRAGGAGRWRRRAAGGRDRAARGLRRPHPDPRPARRLRAVRRTAVLGG